MKLSFYTIAKHCSDITDIKDGIKEITEYLNKTSKPCKTAYIRLYKLNLKLNKLQNDNR
jgi:hypothetical protein